MIDDWRKELIRLADIPILDGVELELSKLIDESSRIEESITTVVRDIPLENDPNKG